LDKRAKIELSWAFAGLALAWSLVACSSGGGGGGGSDSYASKSLATSYSTSGSDGWTGAGSAYCRVYDPSENTDLSYTLSGLPSSGATYLVLTNASQSSSYSLYSASAAKGLASNLSRSSARSSGEGLVRDNPTATAFNHSPWTKVSRRVSRTGLLTSGAAASRSANTVGDTSVSFYTYTTDASGNDTLSLVPATCEKIVENTHLGVTLNVYVQTSALSRSNKVTTGMVDEIANRFIGASTPGSGSYTIDSSSCILQWDQDLFGEYYPESLSGDAYFIDDDRNITIFLADLNSNYSATSYVLGYFYGLNDYRKTVGGAGNSNQRLMFFLDAHLLAGGGYTDELYTTLAHELQHMIHFSSKVVSHGGSGDETWLDEACSVVAEDYVSPLLQVAGPRGVAYTDGSAGSSGNSGGGRLPYFVWWPEKSLTTWNSNLYDYGSSYAFAAWLGRNASPAFFYDLVQGSSTGFSSVESALGGTSAFVGTDVSSPGPILRAWALACLGSSSTSTNQPFRYNTSESSGWYSGAAHGGVSYKLGSIDLANYTWAADSGSGLYTYSTANGLTAAPASNTYVLLQGNSASSPSLSGTVRLHEGVSAMFVVVP